MKRIRIGKDIEIRWPILTNGEQVALEERDLYLSLHLPSCMEIPVQFESEGNIAIFTVSGSLQKQLGAYRLTLWENKGKSGQTAVDYCDAFELVPTTCMEGGNDNNLTTETVDLDTSELVIGLPGASAYDLYKKHNPDTELSEEEYANAPIDAADAANEAAKAANDAVDKIGDVSEALAGKVDKEEGKGLSSNDYTDADKEKLEGLSNYDDTEVRTQLSGKASKEEVAAAAEKTLSDANSYADEQVEVLRSDVAKGLMEFGSEVGEAISDGDTTTLQSAKKYTDDAISAIPTPDVSGQIERHNTSPTAHTDIRQLLNSCIGLPEFNDKTYELTFTAQDGTKLIIDLPIEQMGLYYNEDKKAIEFVNADGSISSIPVSDFVKVYVGSIGAEIQITVEGSEIRASLLNNTVSWDKLTLALQEVIEGKADLADIPTKASELENDSGFVTSEEMSQALAQTVRLGDVLGESDSSIHEVTDPSGKTFYPATVAEGVKMEDGQTLADKQKQTDSALNFITNLYSQEYDNPSATRYFPISVQAGDTFSFTLKNLSGVASGSSVSGGVYLQHIAEETQDRFPVKATPLEVGATYQVVADKDYAYLRIYINNKQSASIEYSILREISLDQRYQQQQQANQAFSDGISANSDKIGEEYESLFGLAVNRLFQKNGMWRSGKGMFTLKFDDSRPSVSKFTALCENLGIPCVFSVINDNLDTVSDTFSQAEIEGSEGNYPLGNKSYAGKPVLDVMKYAVSIGDECLLHGGRYVDKDNYNDYDYLSTTYLKNKLELEERLGSSVHGFAFIGGASSDVLNNPEYFKPSLKWLSALFAYSNRFNALAGGIREYMQYGGTPSEPFPRAIGATEIKNGSYKNIVDETIAGGGWLEITVHGTTSEGVDYNEVKEVIDYIRTHNADEYDFVTYEKAFTERFETRETQTVNFDVLAHSDCALEERIAHLESLLVRVLSGEVVIPKLQVKKLGVWGDNNLIPTGEGAPTKAPDRAGQLYIDTKNNAVYHSVGNNAVSDWKNN